MASFFDSTFNGACAVRAQSPADALPGARRGRHALKGRPAGMVLIYGVVAGIALMGFVSLAVDFGRVQLVKTELRGAADAAARAAAAKLSDGVDDARAAATSVAASNRADGSVVVLKSGDDIELGTWDPEKKSFTVLSGPARNTANAVRVTARRTAARGNAVPLLFGCVVGMSGCDVSASSIASFSSTSTSFGLVGLNSVAVNGNAETDSYNSVSGSYSSSSAGAKGSVASNGNITLKGRVNIRGDAHPGESGSLSRSKTSRVNGSTSPLSDAIGFADVEARKYLSSNSNGSVPSRFRKASSGGGGTAAEDLVVKGSQTLTLVPGTYCFNDVTLSGNAKLVISGPVELYVTGSLTATGNAKTNGNRPGDFTVRVDGKGKVKLAGKAVLHADIYAPRGSADVSGNANLFGALLAKSLKISGNASVHYDESLARVSKSNPAVATVR